MSSYEEKLLWNAPGGCVHFGFFVCDRRVQTRGAGLGQSYSKIHKVRRINANFGFHFSLIFQVFRRGTKLLNKILPTLITRRSQVRVLSPQPHWYTGYDTIACVLFCVSTRENPWYKGKARQVGANLHLPASHFWFFRFLHSGWKPQICTHPLHFLAFLKIRQKVQIWPQA